MNVLFCNIAWMKYYEGANEGDKPKNGGSYVKETEYAHECFNFLDYNSKCYGFVRLTGDLNLELHFKDAKINNDFLKNVLVIWVAANDTNETRVVGWYKNATVYREEQNVEVYTSENSDLCYRVEALSEDCYLLPEEQRTFPINRAMQVGKGTGIGRSNVWYADSHFAETVLIPKVVKYIENYNGEFDNIVNTDEVLNEVVPDIDKKNDFQKLYDEGVRWFEDDNYDEALKFFNSARIIKETPEVLYRLGEILFSLNCFNKAISLFKKVIELEGSKVETLINLAYCYDYIGDRENTLEYCSKIITVSDDSEEGINEKIFYSCVMFNIYLSLRDEKNAKAIIDKIPTYSDDEDSKRGVKQMLITLNSEFNKQVI